MIYETVSAVTANLKLLKYETKQIDCLLHSERSTLDLGTVKALQLLSKVEVELKDFDQALEQLQKAHEIRYAFTHDSICPKDESCLTLGTLLGNMFWERITC